MKKDIPVIILCGGMGTRLAEQTELRPKPLVEIGGKPILWHIMKHYSNYGINEFVLALGYKGEQIKQYFLNFYTLAQNFSVNLANGQTILTNSCYHENWMVHLVDTGQKTMTGTRLQQAAKILGRRTFMMTYGDGVADVNLDELLAFHQKNKCPVTLTAVRPPARFGALEFDENMIRAFKEKSILHEGWINGGFFVLEPEALEYIDGDVMWEHAPMERLASEGRLCGYRHSGFWQCMDTGRDLKYLEDLWETGKAPWKTW